MPQRAAHREARPRDAPQTTDDLFALLAGDGMDDDDFDSDDDDDLDGDYSDMDGDDYAGSDDEEDDDM